MAIIADLELSLLEPYHSFYHTPDCKLSICKEGLGDLFDLSDNPITITIVATDVEVENSYKVTLDRDDEKAVSSFIVTLSTGKIIDHPCIHSHSIYLEQLPNSFYVSIY